MLFARLQARPRLKPLIQFGALFHGLKAMASTVASLREAGCVLRVRGGEGRTVARGAACSPTPVGVPGRLKLTTVEYSSPCGDECEGCPKVKTDTRCAGAEVQAAEGEADFYHRSLP